MPDHRLVLGMKLHADEPAMPTQLDDFHEIPARINPRKLHPVLEQLVPKHVIHLIAVSVPLGNLLDPVDLTHA